jgi:hypothetical protein
MATRLAAMTVIARLDRATQYAAASRTGLRRFGILDPRFRGDDGWYVGTPYVGALTSC